MWLWYSACLSCVMPWVSFPEQQHNKQEYMGANWKSDSFGNIGSFSKHIKVQQTWRVGSLTKYTKTITEIIHSLDLSPQEMAEVGMWFPGWWAYAVGCSGAGPRKQQWNMRRKAFFSHQTTDNRCNYSILPSVHGNVYPELCREAYCVNLGTFRQVPLGKFVLEEIKDYSS